MAPPLLPTPPAAAAAEVWVRTGPGPRRLPGGGAGGGAAGGGSRAGPTAALPQPTSRGPGPGRSPSAAAALVSATVRETAGAAVAFVTSASARRRPRCCLRPGTRCCLCRSTASTSPCRRRRRLLRRRAGHPPVARGTLRATAQASRLATSSRLPAQPGFHTPFRSLTPPLGSLLALAQNEIGSLHHPTTSPPLSSFRAP